MVLKDGSDLFYMSQDQPVMSESLDHIRLHGELCEEVYDFLLQENRRYRQEGQPLDPELIARKRSLLAQLTESLERLKGISRAGGLARSAPLRKLAQRTQQILLKTMLLDKENEQLFLKHALSASSGAFQIIPKPTAKQVKRRYQAQD